MAEKIARDVPADQISLDTCAWRCLSHVSISNAWSDHLRERDNLRQEPQRALESLSESMPDQKKKKETSIEESVRRWRPLSSSK